MKHLLINGENANVNEIIEMVTSGFEEQNVISVQSNSCRLVNTEAARRIHLILVLFTFSLSFTCRT